MKTWMKILMWLGLGAGLGFFAGDKFGYSRAQKEEQEFTIRQHGKDILTFSGTLQDGFEIKKGKIDEPDPLDNGALEALNKHPEIFQEAMEAMEKYRGHRLTDLESAAMRNTPIMPDMKDVENFIKSNLNSGGDIDGDESWAWLQEVPEIPDPPMIEVTNLADPNIKQLHPQDIMPQIISEDEFNRNEDGLDLENLIFYEMDEVLYNERTQQVIEDQDGVVGIGTLFEFYGNPQKPAADTIYVKNETLGTLFRIDRIDGAFTDIVDGQASPTEDDEPEDPDESDDFWDDV